MTNKHEKYKNRHFEAKNRALLVNFSIIQKYPGSNLTFLSLSMEFQPHRGYLKIWIFFLGYWIDVPISRTHTPS